MAAKKRAAPKKPAKKSAMPARRADYGAPIEGFFSQQPQPQRSILEALRKLVEEIAPEATATLKWGMPFYTIDGQMFVALAGFKSHVNLILAGPEPTFVDPKGLLEGDGKTGRHLKLRKLEDLPTKDVRTWLRAAAKLSKSKARSRARVEPPAGAGSSTARRPRAVRPRPDR